MTYEIAGEGKVINSVSYRYGKFNNSWFLESKQEKDCWVEVMDLTEMRIWEYNELVTSIKDAFPDYPIETLHGRFI